MKGEDLDKENMNTMVEEISMETRNRAFLHPKKLAVYLFAVSITMIFAALCSALIVRKAESNWLEFNLPVEMLYSTLIIVASSAALFYAQRSVRKNNQSAFRLGMLLTSLLAFGFCVLQTLSAVSLYEAGIVFAGDYSNPAGSFVYVLGGVHVFHVLLGIYGLLEVTDCAFAGRYHAKNMLSVEMTSIYWHFLGVLWVYLYLFLYFNH